LIEIPLHYTITSVSTSVVNMMITLVYCWFFLKTMYTPRQ